MVGGFLHYFFWPFCVFLLSLHPHLACFFLDISFYSKDIGKTNREWTLESFLCLQRKVVKHLPSSKLCRLWIVGIQMLHLQLWSLADQIRVLQCWARCIEKCSTHATLPWKGSGTTWHEYDGIVCGLGKALSGETAPVCMNLQSRTEMAVEDDTSCSTILQTDERDITQRSLSLGWIREGMNPTSLHLFVVIHQPIFFTLSIWL